MTLHKDGGDAADSITWWTCHGSGSSGVDICFPQLGHRVKLLDGDIIGVRACLLDHCVTELRGERGVILFGAKDDHQSIRQHIHYMPDGPERDKVISDKQKRDDDVQAKHMKKRKTEIERIRALRSDIVEIESGDLVPGIPPTSPEEWMLLEIPNDMRNLRGSTTKKNAYIRSLRNNSASKTELDKARELPASTFYQLTTNEQK